MCWGRWRPAAGGTGRWGWWGCRGGGGRGGGAEKRILPQPPRRIRPEAPRPLQEAGSPQELLFWGVRRGGMPASLLEPHRERWAELQHSRDVLAARSHREPEGAYEGVLAVLPQALSGRFPADHLWSPSRLETYGACPHRFFAPH